MLRMYVAIIRKKILPEYFEAISSEEKKKYELRLNDFAIQAGDTLILEEWDQAYTGRKIEKKVTYVGRFHVDKLFWTEDEIRKNGLQIISLE